MRKEEKTWRE